MGLPIKSNFDWRSAVDRAEKALVFSKPELPDVILTLGSISLVVVCLGLLGVPAFHKLQLRAKAAAAVGNAATLQLAAESYAAVNQGRYPEDALDLLPFLPADSPPENPYTTEDIEFQG